ncbi:MAG TPA: DUF1153 domain-containing protein [Candidatus Paceibacterota bacterium]|nr:DUF1153 domain-containing protein [Candidatus Paceibacterota bacterium]
MTSRHPDFGKPVHVLPDMRIDAINRHNGVCETLPVAVRGMHGELLTLKDLPTPPVRRWVYRWKTVVIALVRGGLITLDEISTRYSIRPEEFLQWEARLKAGGVLALRATRIQEYRSMSETQTEATQGSEEVSEQPETTPQTADIPEQAAEAASQVIEYRNITLNIESAQVASGGISVALTKQEFQILELLVRHVEQVVTREMILEHLYAGKTEPAQKIIDVCICKVRKKIAPLRRVRIDTVWGRGYMLNISE